MTHRRSDWTVLVLAAALVVAGCSARTDGGPVATGKHDDGVHLTPDPASALAQLKLVLDVPGVDPSQCQFAWKRNGYVIVSAASDMLPPEHFKKGDQIRAEVVVPGADGGEARTLAAEVRVTDSAPMVTVPVTLRTSESGSALVVHMECTDPDGDATTPRFRWYRNGDLIEGAEDSTLSVGSFARSDRIAVEVVAVADRVESRPVRSDDFLLENRPPQFTSPPTPLAAGQPVLQYQAVATDADGDVLTFELAEAPAGMSITPAGLIEWTVPTGEHRNGEYVVKIRATDSKGGAATQDFLIRLGSSTP